MFVKGYGGIAWPLTQQLKKQSFTWKKEAQQTFENLKVAVTKISYHF